MTRLSTMIFSGSSRSSKPLHQRYPADTDTELRTMFSTLLKDEVLISNKNKILRC